MRNQKIKLMSRQLFKLAIVITIIYCGFCFGLYLIQNKLIFHPQERRFSSPETTMHLRSNDEDIVVNRILKEGNKAIIYFGGNAEDVSLGAKNFKINYPAYSLYLMHYRGYGGSTGKPGEDDIYADAVNLYNEVKKNKDNISIIGRSIGTGFAVRLASEKDIKRLVLITPYDSIVNVAKSHYPIFPVDLLISAGLNHISIQKM